MKKLSRTAAVLCLVLCMVMTMLPSAFAEKIVLPEWAIEAGWTEERYIDYLAELKKQEEAEKAALAEAAALAEYTCKEATPVEEAAEEAAELEKVTEEVAPAEEATEEAAPAEEVSEEVAPAEEATEEVAPVEEATEEAAPVEEVSEEAAEVEKTPEENVPEEAPAESEQVGETFEESVPDGEIPAQESKENYTVGFHGTNGEIYIMQGDTAADLNGILAEIGYGDIALNDVVEITSSDTSLFSVERDPEGNWIVSANGEFATNQSLRLTKADGQTIEIFVTDEGEVAEVVGGSKYTTLQEAIASIGTTGGTVRLLKSVDDNGTSGIRIDTDKNVTIDFAGYTYNLTKAVIDNIAAKFSGNGSVTLQNGTLKTDSAANQSLISSSVSDLNIRNMFLLGVDGMKNVVAVTAGDADITGNTTIDAGSSSGIAVSAADDEGTADIMIDTTGVVNGKVETINTSAAGIVSTELRNGFYAGDISYTNLDSADKTSGVKVTGGEYFDDVYEFVPSNVDYVDVVNREGKSHAAGGNVGWAAYRSAYSLPTFVDVRKSDGSIELPWRVAARNSTGHYNYINGMLVAPWQTVYIPGFCRWCTANVIVGANSQWYKGTEEGLKFELNGNVSYVTVDNTKVKAKLDGVTAEIEDVVLEKLSAGYHTFRFVLTNGASVSTIVKINPDEEIEWSRDSENGLDYEMSSDVKKILIDHVKVDAEIDGKDVTVVADVLRDLREGKHTVDIVLENTAHIVTYITVK